MQPKAVSPNEALDIVKHSHPPRLALRSLKAGIPLRTPSDAGTILRGFRDRMRSERQRHDLQMQTTGDKPKRANRKEIRTAASSCLGCTCPMQDNGEQHECYWHHIMQS